MSFCAIYCGVHVAPITSKKNAVIVAIATMPKSSGVRKRAKTNILIMPSDFWITLPNNRSKAPLMVFLPNDNYRSLIV